mgnify:CR=1 FL=1
MGANLLASMAHGHALRGRPLLLRRLARVRVGVIARVRGRVKVKVS